MADYPALTVLARLRSAPLGKDFLARYEHLFRSQYIDENVINGQSFCYAPALLVPTALYC